MRKYLMLSLMGVLILVLAACADDSDVDEQAAEDGGDDGAATEESASGDIVVAMQDDAVSLDPHGSNDSASSQVRQNIYESLVSQDTDMELVPGLAEEWESVEEDVWNFKLREGTTFHSGEEFTAEDVKATLERVSDEAVASEVAFLFEMITEVEVVGDYEVNIHTEYPFAPLPSHLAHNTGGIMSKSIIDEDYQNALDEAGVDMTADEYYELRAEGGGEYEEVMDQISENVGNVIASNPDGTDHGMLENREPGQETVLTKFEDFQGGERNFDSITFRVIPEVSARLAELETGGIQVAHNIDASNANRVTEGENTELIEQESLRTDYLGFNVQKEPFDDVKVRQAIAHAIDREAIVEGVYEGMGISATHPIPPDVWGYDDSLEGQQFDMERAQELLAESDYPDGFSAELWVRDDQMIVDTALYIQESLSELGIDLSVERMEWGAFLDRTGQGDQEMYLLGWTTVTADADYGLYALHHSDNFGAVGNRSFFGNDELDEALDNGRTESDEDARADAYSTAQEIITEEAPIAPIVHSNFSIGVDTSQVEGVELDALGDVRLENVTFNE
ncbi:glutathione ABC transporter substrate-binding protein [Lacicoccus qingdaonensis]|uniref:Peptide/nickel transport system substrate-binding protein n=1 Tax=Lacicoccus qingdaonensis TaxID=576118 RepID=A0A1G9B1S9_9BACL|nr:glutathione ABC transporter substrate-binding protein [Salinicoccus qingdaonensis]SDK33423.1 peptide/nickel transport system substrate-binding protein [Salinicoccus qingdaonensis]